MAASAFKQAERVPDLGGVPRSGVKRVSPPFLLTMPGYGGSLAAVRALGEGRVPITVAGDEWLAPARWSRYVTRRVGCPPASDANRFLEWLLAFGDREPKHVLYATSDDLAFLFAVHADRLSTRFWMYQPPVETLVEVLDKKRLLTACESVGLARVPTWFPETEADVVRIAREAPFPLLLKTRTQVRRVRQNKGIVVHRAEELVPAYRRFMAGHRFLSGLEDYFGDVSQPMVQRYVPDAAERVYSVTGFIDRTGSLSAARAAVKVLQRTRPVGLGLCFEAAPLDPRLAEAALRLCGRVGHYGVFEVEFLRDGDQALVIDLNPRFYGQMGFDAARGMPLALMTYYAAVGDADALHATVQQAAHAAHATPGATIYTHRFVFELLIRARRWSGSMSADEYRHWRRWYDDHRDGAADASADGRDWLPGVLHAAAEVRPAFNTLRRVLSRRLDRAPRSSSHAASDTARS
jgi:predicted ATP-grasp superfamily ATP-dependent carboligase